MSRQSQAWKNLERKVAKHFGGARIPRGSNFADSLPDVVSDEFVIECKYRKRLPALIMNAFNQCEKYVKDGKIPIVVLKEKNSRDEIMCIKMSDFIIEEEDDD